MLFCPVVTQSQLLQFIYVIFVVKGRCNCTITDVFKDFDMNLLASTRVFHKKIKLVFVFVISDVFFVDVRHIQDNYRSF